MIRDLWDDWWKVLAVFALIVGVVWFVIECNQNERTEFLNCFEDTIGEGQTLYYADEAYHEQISRYDALDAAKACYDDTQGVNSPSDGEPLDRP